MQPGKEEVLGARTCPWGEPCVRSMGCSALMLAASGQGCLLRARHLTWRPPSPGRGPCSHRKAIPCPAGNCPDSGFRALQSHPTQVQRRASTATLASSRHLSSGTQTATHWLSPVPLVGWSISGCSGEPCGDYLPASEDRSRRALLAVPSTPHVGH